MHYTDISDGTRHIEVSALCLGTMYFGTTVDEATSWAILDRFVEAGGTFIDTANAYTFWAGGGSGGESEEVIGRWLQSRNAHDTVVVASKVGAHIADTSRAYDAHNREGLSADVILDAAAASRKRLGVDRIDLYYAHADDRQTPLAETVTAMAQLVDRGDVAMIGASNHATWRLAQARDLARSTDAPRYAAIQQRHSYLEARHLRGLVTDALQLPVTPELLDYARAQDDLTVLGYSPLLGGAYTRRDRVLPPDYDTADASRRLNTLQDVAAELGATPNQVVLAWMLQGDPPIIPVLGVSTVDQLGEALQSVDIELTPEQQARLDT